ncbi:ribosome biogenesis protein SLX9-domain-containing protein [Amylocarpus encephaloides]|uniref:Ribosome biogenesis protein SLX9 n=1 Tax=Amylocarpus encephaloides TaxID=45428 RepID=A0A9P8C7F1_9HELO|nr:ribosome biogenesis protein SLX9-domain-containing protein [Amylocarpus encephaloides]
MAPPSLHKPKGSRPSLRTKTSNKSGSGLISRPPTTHRPGAIISDSFISSKKDKRTIKSSAFLNRIQKAHAKPAKRRRPNKKLVANLESLADALPELDEDDRGTVGGKGVVGTRIKMESLTSGKGLMKRRGKVERVEKERFAKNMAQLMGAQQGATTQAIAATSMADGAAEVTETQPSATATRFAALRNWIGQTMEKEKAFETKE